MSFAAIDLLWKVTEGSLTEFRLQFNINGCQNKISVHVLYTTCTDLWRVMMTLFTSNSRISENILVLRNVFEHSPRQRSNMLIVLIHRGIDPLLNSQGWVLKMLYQSFV